MIKLKLSNIFDLDQLGKEIETGYITKRKHPSLPYFILNYSTRTQIEWRWNIHTVNCRGLIVDENLNVIARPFKKFFTLDQWATLKNHVWNLYGAKYKDMFDGDFEVQEKADGSLGILFYNPKTNHYEIATRGSFESEQAIRGTEILQKKYPNIKVDHENFTYLFEIIYPENKIVVDYGDMEDIILLGIVNNHTGKENSLVALDFDNPGFYTTRKHPICSGFNWRDLDKLNWKNSEGFVVRFLNNDIRVKIKFEEYKSLHKILCGLNEKLVFEWAQKGYDCGQILDKIPQPERDWATNLLKQYEDDYDDIEKRCKDIIARDGGLIRKKFAYLHADEYFSSALFKMLDKKDYSEAIWKAVARKNKV